MDLERLEELLGRHFEAALAPEEESELAARLSASAEARALTASYMRIEGSLAYLGKAGTLESRPRRLRRRASPAPSPLPWILGGAVAAAFLVVIALAPTGRVPAPAAETAEVAPEEERKVEAARVARLERELRRAEPEPFREPKPPPRPEPPAPAPPARPPGVVEPPAVPKPAPRTEPAIARLEVEGSAPQDLPAGTSVETRGVVRFPDGSRLELSGALRDLGRGTLLTSGTLTAVVSRQPAGRPFVLLTPQAELRVLGTRFTLAVTKEGTRLEVAEGRVRLTRLSDKRSVDVGAGQFAVAQAGVELSSRPLPIDEVLLTADKGRISGDEWRLVKEGEGAVLEALRTGNDAATGLPVNAAKVNAWFARGRSRSWVTFVFDADANREYRVWVRAKTLAAQGRQLADSVMLEVANARFVHRPADWHPYADYLCTFDGFFEQPGFSWCGGFFDPGKTQTPISLRFNAGGRQVIRLHAMETPIQVDAVRLSTTQATRPTEARPGKR